jgi:hypothetical protein
MKVVSYDEWDVERFSSEGVVLVQKTKDDSIIKMIANKIAMDVKGIGRIYFDLMDGFTRVRLASKTSSESEMMSKVSSLAELLLNFGKKNEDVWIIQH